MTKITMSNNVCAGLHPVSDEVTHIMFSDCVNSETRLSISSVINDYIEIAILYKDEVDPVARFPKDTWTKTEVLKATLNLLDKNDYYRKHLANEVDDVSMMLQAISDSRR